MFIFKFLTCDAVCHCVLYISSFWHVVSSNQIETIPLLNYNQNHINIYGLWVVVVVCFFVHFRFNLIFSAVTMIRLTIFVCCEHNIWLIITRRSFQSAYNSQHWRKRCLFFLCNSSSIILHFDLYTTKNLKMIKNSE